MNEILFTSLVGINPSELYENYEGDLQDWAWEFNIRGVLRKNICQKQTSAMALGGRTGIRSVTTSQFIVQEGYMIQFKVLYFSYTMLYCSYCSVFLVVFSVF